MPESRKEVPAGSASVSLTPPESENQEVTRNETIGEVTIPAGALWVRIRVAGAIQDGDNEADATINGTTWSVGSVEEFHAQFDRVNNKYKPLPAFEINGNGGRVFYAYST